MARLRLGALISGRGSNLQALIEAAAAPDYPAEIVLVISNEAGAKGLERAAAAGLEHRTVDHRDFADRPAFEAVLTEALTEARVELICLAGFMRLLTDGFVGRWAGRLINIHPSLLPAFRGVHVHERVLEAGVRFSGCTVHYVVPEMDAGPIIVQAAVPVAADDDAESLAARVLAAEHRIYPLAVRWIAEGRVRMQDGRVIVAGIGPVGPSVINPSEVGASVL